MFLTKKNFLVSLRFALCLHFVLSLQFSVCILYLVCILHLICSLQSAVYGLHFVLTECNCRNKDQCPLDIELDNKCLTSSVIYNAQVTTNNATKNYIGLTEGTFKQRFSQHKATFKNRKYTNSTELSKYIWQLGDNNQDFNI